MQIVGTNFKDVKDVDLAYIIEASIKEQGSGHVRPKYRGWALGVSPVIWHIKVSSLNIKVDHPEDNYQIEEVGPA